MRRRDGSVDGERETDKLVSRGAMVCDRMRAVDWSVSGSVVSVERMTNGSLFLTRLFLFLGRAFPHPTNERAAVVFA